MARYKATAGNSSRLGHVRDGLSTSLTGLRTGVSVFAAAAETSTTKAGNPKFSETDQYQVYVDGGDRVQGGNSVCVAKIKEVTRDRREIEFYNPNTGELVATFELS